MLTPALAEHLAEKALQSQLSRVGIRSAQPQASVLAESWLQQEPRQAWCLLALVCLLALEGIFTPMLSLFSYTVLPALLYEAIFI